MYPPHHHQSHDKQKMIAVIKQYPLATLVSIIDSKPLITHLPIIFNDVTGKLVGHIDKNNPQVDSLQNETEVTLIFNGPNTYISPSIYTTEQLPTWNYIIVHITGKASAITDPEKAKQTLVRMSSFLEGPKHNYSLEMNNPKMDKLINYIQAFEIDITNWEGKFKLSQDKCEQDQENAKQQLLKNSVKNINEFLDEVY